VIAAAVAVRGAGAPLAAAVLLGLSAIVVSHPPPIGPIGLASFAAAVLVLYRNQLRVATTFRAAEPRSSSQAPVRAAPAAATTSQTAGAPGSGM